jgi:DNA polymerase-3 subunit epsilon
MERVMMQWTEVPIYLIDFEGHRDYGVVEYGIVTLLGGQLTDVQTRLCRAGRELRPEESRVHGIRYRDSADTPPFLEEWSRFVGMRQSGVFGAHHAVFENALLKSVWPYPKYSPDFQHPGEMVVDWAPWVDTRVLYESRFPDLPSYRLADLVSRFQLDKSLEEFARGYCPAGRSRYHCALFDALACAVLLLHLMDSVGSESTTIDWVLRESRRSRGRCGADGQGELFSD